MRNSQFKRTNDLTLLGNHRGDRPDVRTRAASNLVVTRIELESNEAMMMSDMLFLSERHLISRTGSSPLPS